jgi:hypothetical protein
VRIASGAMVLWVAACSDAAPITVDLGAAADLSRAKLGLLAIERGRGAALEAPSTSLFAIDPQAKNELPVEDTLEADEAVRLTLFTYERFSLAEAGLVEGPVGIGETKRNSLGDEVTSIHQLLVYEHSPSAWTVLDGLPPSLSSIRYDNHWFDCPSFEVDVLTVPTTEGVDFAVGLGEGFGIIGTGDARLFLVRSDGELKEISASVALPGALLPTEGAFALGDGEVFFGGNTFGPEVGNGGLYRARVDPNREPPIEWLEVFTSSGTYALTSTRSLAEFVQEPQEAHWISGGRDERGELELFVQTSQAGVFRYTTRSGRLEKLHQFTFVPDSLGVAGVARVKPGEAIAVYVFEDKLMRWENGLKTFEQPGDPNVGLTSAAFIPGVGTVIGTTKGRLHIYRGDRRWERIEDTGAGNAIGAIAPLDEPGGFMFASTQGLIGTMTDRAGLCRARPVAPDSIRQIGRMTSRDFLVSGPKSDLAAQAVIAILHQR